MAEKAHGGVGRTIDSQEPPGVGVGGGQVTNIRTFSFLIPLTRGCLANFYNGHVVNVVSFVACGASGAVARLYLHGV